MHACMYVYMYHTHMFPSPPHMAVVNLRSATADLMQKADALKYALFFFFFLLRSATADLMQKADALKYLKSKS